MSEDIAFSPEPSGTLFPWSPVLRLAHDFHPAPTIRLLRKAYLGDHALHYFHTGSGTYELNGVTCPIEPGCIFLVRPGQGYCFRLAPNREVRMFNVHFDLEEKLEYACPFPCPDDAFPGKEILPQAWPDRQKLPRNCGFEELFQMLLTAAGQHGLRARFQVKAKLLEILGLLYEHAQPPPPGSSVGRHALSRALELIRRDLATPWSLGTLATEVGISRSLLCELCRQVTGLPVQQYIRHERIRQARYLLLYSGKPIKEIAAYCGFTNVHHFTRVFKATCGLPPGVFRARHSNLDE